MAPAAVTLHEIQEAVKQACGGRQQDEEEQEADSANTFLQTATEKHQGCDAQEKLSKGSVVKRVRQEPVQVSILKHRGANTEDPLSEVKVCLGAKQNTRPKYHG